MITTRILLAVVGILAVAVAAVPRRPRGWLVRSIWSAVVVAGAALAVYGLLAHAKPERRRPKSTLLTLCPIDSARLPSSRDLFVGSVERGLRQILDLPAGQKLISIDGAAYPQMRAMRIDLSGAAANASKRFEKSKGVADDDAWVSIARLELLAHPFIYQNAKADVSVTADDVHVRVERDKHALPVLVLDELWNGRLAGSMKITQIEALLREELGKEAGKHDVEVDKVELSLQARGDRSVSVAGTIKAHRMLGGRWPLRATIKASGQLDIDDNLNARVSNLRCDGDGVVGAAITALLEPMVQQYDGWRTSLSGSLLGGIKLRDLRVGIDEAVHVTAAFGEKKR